MREEETTPTTKIVCPEEKKVAQTREIAGGGREEIEEWKDLTKKRRVEDGVLEIHSAEIRCEKPPQCELVAGKLDVACSPVRQDRQVAKPVVQTVMHSTGRQIVSGVGID